MARVQWSMEKKKVLRHQAGKTKAEFEELVVVVVVVARGGQVISAAWTR